MKIKQIAEEFVDAIKDKNRYFEIFKNPTKKELLKVINKKYGEVRFIIDLKKNDLFVFDSDLLHQSAAEKINIPYEEYSDRYLFSYGNVTNGKIEPNIHIMSGSETAKKKLRENLSSFKMLDAK